MLDVMTYSEPTAAWQLPLPLPLQPSTAATTAVVTTTVTTVSGQGIAKARRTPRERARLAARWLSGAVVIEPPTAALASRVFNVGQSTICRVVAELDLVPTNSVDLLVHHWHRASPTERARFGLEVGAEDLWDEAIVPNT
jgi:hypothetical protein